MLRLLDRPLRRLYGNHRLRMSPAKKGTRPPILAKGLEATVLATLDDVDLDRCRLDGCALDNRRGERFRLDGVHIVGGSLRETKVTALAWLDVLCERCDLSMLDWPKAKWTRVEIHGCRATGAKVLEGEFDNVRFVDCHLEYASFPAAHFRESTFDRCRLKEADFSGADLTGTSFVDCDLDGIDFTRAKLQGADISTSTLREIRVGASDVRGLVVNREQATALSRLFGLVIRED